MWGGCRILPWCTYGIIWGCPCMMATSTILRLISLLTMDMVLQGFFFRVKQFFHLNFKGFGLLTSKINYLNLLRVKMDMVSRGTSSFRQEIPNQSNFQQTSIPANFRQKRRDQAFFDTHRKRESFFKQDCPHELTYFLRPPSL